MGRNDLVWKAINERLRCENRELKAENIALKAQVAELQASLAKVQKRMEELERSSARQTAPFRRRKRTGDNKPGRKPGFRGRQRPRPPVIDRVIEVPLDPTAPSVVARSTNVGR